MDYIIWIIYGYKTHATHRNASDWHICTIKQELSDFWTISYRCVQIVMLIIIKMHFVLFTTISLLFVWESPPPPLLHVPVHDDLSFKKTTLMTGFVVQGHTCYVFDSEGEISNLDCCSLFMLLQGICLKQSWFMTFLSESQCVDLFIHVNNLPICTFNCEILANKPQRLWHGPILDKWWNICLNHNYSIFFTKDAIIFFEKYITIN